MAGTLLHITLANEALSRCRDLHPRLATTAEHLGRYRLGSIFVDLPYFDKLWLSGLKTILGRPLSFNTWGTIIHRRSPTGLALAMLDTANTPEEVAFALGSLTHQAADLAFHPHIQQAVRTRTSDRARFDSVHKQIEDRIDSLSHRHLLGHNGIGRPYAGRTMSLIVSSTWTRLAVDALKSVHGASPSASRLRRWLMNARLFGAAISAPFSPWVSTDRDPESGEFEVAVDLTERALDDCREYLLAGCRYLDGDIDGTELSRVVVNRSMLDGGEPLAAVEA